VNKSSYRILAVEDNASDVFLMREALKEHGVNADLTVITNGQSAIRYFSLMRREDPVPELILLDVNLPRKNGLEVLKGLRANPLLQQVPVIVFTSSESFDDRRKRHGYRLKPSCGNRWTWTSSCRSAQWSRICSSRELKRNMGTPVCISGAPKVLTVQYSGLVADAGCPGMRLIPSCRSRPRPRRSG
jgi:CheY-like chemotaxis protein